MTKHEINTLTTFTWPKGFYADGLHAGLKEEKKDLGWLYSKVPAAAAGVYTTNQFQAAPTKLTKQTVNLDHQLQAVVMNSQNNATPSSQESGLNRSVGRRGLNWDHR